MTLEQRAVACARWRWVEGMLAVKHGLRSRVSAEYRGHLHQPAGITAWRSDSVPDLADPATLGCLLALVREAWGDPEAHLARVEQGARAVERDKIVAWLRDGADIAWEPASLQIADAIEQQDHLRAWGKS